MPTLIVHIHTYIHLGSDLVSVMTAAITVINWSDLGLVLGVPPHVVNEIRKDYTSVQDRRHYVLYHWIETGDATWAGLVEALHSPLVNMKGLAGHIASNHPCKYVCRIISCVVAKPSCCLTCCVFS